MASTTGWSNSTALGVPGNTQASNNSTNLAFESSGYRHGLYGTYTDQNQNANFWTSDQSTFQNPNHPLELYSWVTTLKNNESDLIRYDNEAKDGFMVNYGNDTALSTLSKYSNGNHSFGVSYQFGRPKKCNCDDDVEIKDRVYMIR